MGNLFSHGDIDLTIDEKSNIIKNENLIELRTLYREARTKMFPQKEIESNKYLNELIKTPWILIAKDASSEGYIGVYFKNRMISSDVDKFSKFITGIFGENIKVRSCCNISIIWGTSDDEMYEINFGRGCGKYQSLKQIDVLFEKCENENVIEL